MEEFTGLFGSEEQSTSLVGRKSISFLLGAGFSVPMGYPTGDKLNERLLNFDDSAIGFAPDGSLVTSTDGSKPKFMTEGVMDFHQDCFQFCKSLIKKYTEEHKNSFDYELFCDFIKSDKIKEERYRKLYERLSLDPQKYDLHISNVPTIYHQMVSHLLKDRNGETWYDGEGFNVNQFDGYEGLLTYLSELSKEFIVNVHTLNHDLLFESFYKTGYINGKISDGFDEYGSRYYGKLKVEGRTYHCRLERYRGIYNSTIRLYKLHGSLDYVPFYRRDKNCLMFPENYVKLKRGIGPAKIMKSRKRGKGYDYSPFEYHADFLTGTSSKIERYNEPLLFRKLFEKFRKNLQNAEMLIIIGYGCKDRGINDMIKENFDYKHKPCYIVDAYTQEGSMVYQLKEELNAKLLKVEINDISKNTFA